MNTKKALVFVVFTLFFMMTTGVHAAGTGDRYFVKSTSQFWKKSFQVRNVFDSGFTADLSEWQLKLAKVFNIGVTPIKKLNILSTTTTDSKTDVKPLITTPVNQIGWGVQTIYGSTLKNTLPSGGKGINIAVLDTGALIGHSDIKGQVVACSDFTGVFGFVENSCEDNNGHGTLVAGVIAGNSGADGKGIYGVAPESNLMIYKVCSDEGTCFSDDVSVGIRYAVDSGANIILLSLGSDSGSSLISDAISYAVSKKVMVIAAAGNDGPYSDSLDHPASNTDVVSVGAVDDKLLVANWSARGSNKVSVPYSRNYGDLEIVGPGVNIESISNHNNYVTSSGSSLAAAHIAGLAAKEWQANDKNPAKATREFLYKLSNDILPAGDDPASGWGIPQL